MPRERLEVAGNLKLARALQSAGAIERMAPTHRLRQCPRDEIDALAPAIAELRGSSARTCSSCSSLAIPATPPARAAPSFGAELAIVDSEAAISGAGRLVWLDEMGTLAKVYGRATIGIVCGTFSPIGGHDLTEPLHLGAASIYGPHIERQRPLHEALQGLGVAIQVETAVELPGAIGGLLDDPAAREEQITRFSRAVARRSAAPLGHRRHPDRLAASLGIVGELRRVRFLHRVIPAKAGSSDCAVEQKTALSRFRGDDSGEATLPLAALRLVVFRVQQPMQVHHEIAHLGIVDRQLRLLLPHRVGRGVVRIDPDEVDRARGP